MAKQGNGKRRRRRKRPRTGPASRWYNAPQGKQIKLACGATVMRVGGDIVEIREAQSEGKP